MSSKVQSLTAKFLGTGLILLIAISFLLTGYEGTGSSNKIITVGSKTAGIKEYRAEFRRQLEFFKSYMGNKELNSAQIEQFGIKKTALNNLVSKLLMVELADDVGIHPAPLNITKNIKEMDIFHTEKQFDLNKYKLLLARNNLTPATFEAEITDSTKLQALQSFMNNIYVSEKYIEDVNLYKNKAINSSVLILKIDDVKKSLTITKQDIADYLAKAENISKVEDVFNSRKGRLDQPEQLKARHILIKANEKNQSAKKKEIDNIYKKLNTKNFKSMANKYTEDTSGKGKGGDLNWFGKGRMVPEFEKAAFALKKGEISKPVKTNFGYHVILLEDKKEAKKAKLADHRDKIAQELLRTNKSSEVQKLVSEKTATLKTLLAQNNFKKIKKLQKDLNFTLEEKVSLNRFDGTVVYPTLSQEKIATLFSEGKNSIIELKNASEVVLVKNLGNLKINNKSQPSNLATTLGRSFSQKILDHLKETTKVKMHVPVERL